MDSTINSVLAEATSKIFKTFNLNSSEEINTGKLFSNFPLSTSKFGAKRKLSTINLTCVSF